MTVKLTQKEVARIKDLLCDKWTAVELAEIYDVHPSTIRRIAKDERWAEVKWPNQSRPIFLTRTKFKRFSDQQIEDMLDMLVRGEPLRVVGEAYGASISVVHKIKQDYM